MSVVLDAADRLLPVYRRPDVLFTRGRGAWLFDESGRGYLDFISGVGVVSLGHAHEGLATALAEQAGELVHTSNLFHHPLQAPVAERLTRLSGMARAFLCNSGTEAVEACLKFARRFWHSEKAPREGFVALEHGFHGRTMGALSVTWDAHYRDPFAPLIGPVTFVSPNDPAALASAVTDRTAAVIVEPIQGEGGVRPLSRAFADAITAACRRTGALLIADEVQTGLGRTGAPFASTALGLRPDLMAVGKALGAGFPVAAALFSHRVAAVAQPGDHGSTYGGNVMACRAALVFLDALMTGGVQEHVQVVGTALENGLRRLAAAEPAILEVRGAGLMWGLDITKDAVSVVDAARERGLLINRTSSSVIRLLPPFTITSDEAAQAVGVLAAALRAGTSA
jgi:acetylornithine/N-succinyldiaminopimelate aminotransferase